jgi:DNA-binding NtrC family response regulator
MSEMRKLPGIEHNHISMVTVLSVSPLDEDSAALDRIFRNESHWAAYTKCRWRLAASSTLASGLANLREWRIPLILCERDLSPGSWIDMLDQIALLPDPPFLIVTSRLADERFWAEALNRGAYDVLAKPFDQTEVVRVVSLAWLHWKVRHEHPAEVPQAWKAASGM